MGKEIWIVWNANLLSWCARFGVSFLGVVIEGYPIRTLSLILVYLVGGLISGLGMCCRYCLAVFDWKSQF